MREALYYARENDKVRCLLCPHRCLIPEGKRGICRQRKNQGGKLIAEGYGMVSSIAMDPIEKKPLYHFYPGSNILSVGGLGCNLRCSFCQNWHIAHSEQSLHYFLPEKLAGIALSYGSIGITFTYNEPVIWCEYILDAAPLFKQNELKVVLVTNGFVNPGPLDDMLHYVDALNIDVKAFDESFYRDVCGGSLAAVKEAVELAASKAHVEITTLVIGGLNDNRAEIAGLARWLAQIDKGIPLHLSRYFPNYKMQLPPTPVDTLYELKEVAGEYLDYIYIGNVWEADNDTYCPACANKIVERGISVEVKGLQCGKCSKCGKEIPIIL